MKEINKQLINNFTETSFMNAFQTYFAEFEIVVDDWEKFFQEMNEEKGNQAFVLTEKENTIAFILFRIEELSNWFFHEEVYFIRELWVSPRFRKQNIASNLLNQVENLAKIKKIHKLILTTDSDAELYLKNDFRMDDSYRAKNKDQVFVKNI
ncbi:GNAT family N-acetyltransferase [Vagococcus silagei]|uniref:GNAT family N-acetyltransferase n=1 Tax=Vagococcus silagei TaxID=2508885 RepID=UPI0013A63066|nr:GNAT family N-acetyltransferase [Vagococcus silagei]